MGLARPARLPGRPGRGTALRQPAGLPRAAGQRTRRGGHLLARRLGRRGRGVPVPGIRHPPACPRRAVHRPRRLARRSACCASGPRSRPTPAWPAVSHPRPRGAAGPGGRARTSLAAPCPRPAAEPLPEPGRRERPYLSCRNERRAVNTLTAAMRLMEDGAAVEIVPYLAALGGKRDSVETGAQQAARMGEPVKRNAVIQLVREKIGDGTLKPGAPVSATALARESGTGCGHQPAGAAAPARRGHAHSGCQQERPAESRGLRHFQCSCCPGVTGGAVEGACGLAPRLRADAAGPGREARRFGHDGRARRNRAHMAGTRFLAPSR